MTDKRPSIGLALGAGASRGWAHIGVIRCLEEAGIVPDIVCGTSAGALVGGFYAAGRLDVLESWVRDLTVGRMLSYVNVRRHGALFGRKLLRQLAEHGRNLELNKLRMRFAAVAADLATGREVRIETGPLMKAVAASGACPGLFPPVKIGKRWTVDGALANPVPVSACRALGAQFVIAVDLCGSRQERRASAPAGSSFLNGLSKLGSKRLARAVRLKGLKAQRALRYQAGAPDVVAMAMRSASLIRDLLGRPRTALDEPDTLIAPQPVPMVGPNQAATAIAAGREATERALSARQEKEAPAREPSPPSDDIGRFGRWIRLDGRATPAAAVA